MTDHLDSGIRKARKAHRCDACEFSIEPGTNYHWTKSVDCGFIYEWKQHIRCRDLCDALDEAGFFGHDGINPGWVVESHIADIADSVGIEAAVAFFAGQPDRAKRIEALRREAGDKVGAYYDGLCSLADALERTCS